MQLGYPKAIGAYSAFREAGGFLFLSGQIPLNVQGEMISGGIREQTSQVLDNIKAILLENDLNFSDIVKTTVLLADISDFNAMNEVYATYFKPPYPSRSAFCVKDLPKGARVEIEVIAFKK